MPGAGSFSNTRLALSLTVAMMAGTVVGFIPGTLSPFIVESVPLTAFHVGLLAAVPSAVGALLSPYAGRWVDAVGGARALLVMLSVSAVALALFALSPSFEFMLGACLVGGLGVAITNPATNYLALSRASGRGLFLVFGLKQSGVQFGAAIVGLVLPSIAVMWSWRVAVLSVVSLFVVGLILPAASHHSRPPMSAAVDAPVAGAASSRSIDQITVYAALFGAAGGAAAVHLPLYANQEVGLPPATAAVVGGVLGLASALSRVFLGAVGKAVKNVPLLLVLMATVSCIASVLIFISGYFVLGATLTAAAALLGVAAGWNVLGVLFVIRSVPKGQTGAVSGRIQAAYLSGLVVGPLAFGAMVAPFGYGLAWSIVGICFAGAVLTALSWSRELGLR